MVSSALNLLVTTMGLASRSRTGPVTQRPVFSAGTASIWLRNGLAVSGGTAGMFCGFAESIMLGIMLIRPTVRLKEVPIEEVSAFVDNDRRYHERHFSLLVAVPEIPSAR